MNFACSGEMSSTLLFDYYGDPDVPINELLVCFDTSDVFPKDPGYVYTCYSVLSHIPFGPDAELSGSRDVEACCLRESPEDAVAAFCRIDAAQDFCLGLNDNLNELRKKIPLILKFKEVNHQLLNLNEFLAASATQTDCAATLAKQFLATGDIVQWQETAKWYMHAKMELDSDDGWPWFRNPVANINGFTLDGGEPTGEACIDASLPGDGRGELSGGQLDVSDGEASTSVRVSSGRFSLGRATCNGDTCPFELKTLELAVSDFVLGEAKFIDIRAALVAPARGDLTGTKVRLAGAALRFAVTFKAVLGGEPMFDGAAINLEMRADGEATATVTQDSFSIERLKLSNWPIEMELTTSPATIRGTLRQR